MSHVRSVRSKGIILARVGYEWKAIYRRLTRIDKGNTGLVTMKQLDDAMVAAGVNLTKDDTNKVIALFAQERGDPENPKQAIINYHKMSVDMGL